MNNSLDFSGKVALVTGAAAGMGLATAKAFAEAGAAVVLADYKEEAVKAEAQKLAASGYKAIALRCDVSDDAQVAAMVDRTAAKWGQLIATSTPLPTPWAKTAYEAVDNDAMKRYVAIRAANSPEDRVDELVADVLRDGGRRVQRRRGEHRDRASRGPD